MGWRQVAWLLVASLVVFFLVMASRVSADEGEAKKTVAELDRTYQAAVQRNDAEEIGRLLADDFVLVTGSGKVYTKSDLLNDSRSRRVAYEQQDDTEQVVRVWGDTAVITARLRVKGSEGGKLLEYTLWFSDTYVRRKQGWQYVFGQSSLPLPKGQ